MSVVGAVRYRARLGRLGQASTEIGHAALFDMYCAHCAVCGSETGHAAPVGCAPETAHAVLRQQY
eukprot:594753-Rhodomonas_salina.2